MTTIDLAPNAVGTFEESFQIPTYSKWPITLVSGLGSTVTDANGSAYLDFYGGHCVNLLGHCHANVVDAVKAQTETLMFYSNVVHSDIRTEAARLLTSSAGAGSERVYFCNSGTEANETALKIARKMTGKQAVIATEKGFHGRTMGSLAVTWNAKYREPYSASLADSYFVPFGEIDALLEVVESRNDIAAIIMEPIQSMAGIISAPPSYFQAVRELCSKHGVLLIFDEIQTGVGRTGTFLYSESVGVKPDMTTLAKSLGSGVPVGAVLSTSEVAESVQPGDQGSTFGGGMLASAAVVATLKTIQSENIMDRARAIFSRIAEDLVDQDIEISGAGCLIGLRFTSSVAALISRLRQDGILVGGSSDPNVIRVMPPATATTEEVDYFIMGLKRAVAFELQDEVAG